MASTPTPATPASHSGTPVVTQESQEIRIVSHSPIFYWWPVWAFGFLMFLITFAQNTFMVTIPPHTEPRHKVEVSVTVKDKKAGTETTKLEDRDAYVLPAGKKVPLVNPLDDTSKPVDPYIHMSPSKAPGVIFTTVLLLVILITNVQMRGMWSILVIVSAFLLFLILHLMEILPLITVWASYLDVRINAAGYLLLSTVLFIIWFVTVFFFDKRIYIVFSALQLRVCTEIGSGEKVYDARGMALEKQQSDLFRHWVLGLGAGDLLVKTSGAQAHTFDLPNVLFIHAKIRAIERLVQRQVVQTNKS